MMAYKGKFVPMHPKKYAGDASNIVFRSLWERKVMVDLDANPNVLLWGSEEVVIPYVSPKDGKIHRYFPDFIVRAQDRNGDIKVIMLEIKPEKETKPPSTRGRKRPGQLLKEQMTYDVNQAKWAAARAYCAARNIEFKVVTEKLIFPKAK
jgi:hypothetical protein